MTQDFEERDAADIDAVLASIRAVWIKRPGFRFGQLVVMAVDPPDSCPKLFGMGDDRFVQHLESLGQWFDQQSSEK